MSDELKDLNSYRKKSGEELESYLAFRRKHSVIQNKKGYKRHDKYRKEKENEE